MNEETILAEHGFTKTQANRAIAKPVHKRTDAEQSLIVALVTLHRGRP